MRQQKPNILFIMADQMIPFLTGAYGHPVVKTPNLNWMVEEGVRFNTAYSPCPVCAPARASLMTGKYVSNIGAYDNAASFSCEEPTFAHYLTLAGYDTGLVGKMHFIGPDQLHGFSRRFNSSIYTTGFDWAPIRGVENQSVLRDVSYTGPSGHAFNYIGEGIQVGRWSQYLSYDEEVHFRALEYLRAHGVEQRDAREQGKTSQPFFLCVSYHHPHEPFWPPKDLWDLYEGEEIEVPEFPKNLEETYSTLDKWLNVYHSVGKAENLRDPESMRLVRRAYYALVTYIDIKVGELLTSLEENGFRENTIVVFASDHGDMLCEKGMVQKRTFYEWSSRIPLIIRFPDGWQAGTTCAKPVNLIDLLPTFLDMAGVEKDERSPVDGRSLMGLLDGSDAEDWVAFSEYHSQGCHAPCFMIRQGHYKYVYIHGYESQLFDLETDPGEWHNLAGKPEYKEIEAELKARILEKFDPDVIEGAVTASVKKRWLVKRAMQVTGTRWDIESRTALWSERHTPGAS